MSRPNAKQSNQSMLQNIEQDVSHHLTGSFLPPTPITPLGFRPGSPALLTPSALKALGRFSSDSEGLWSDLKSMRWMRVPASSFKMILYLVMLYFNFRWLQSWNLIPDTWLNPFEPLIFISHRIPDSPPDDPRYQKGYLDLLFIAFYVIVWSFIRQAITLYAFHPLARRCGIKKSAKVDRFGEQGYALTYFSVMSILGLGVMSQSKTWWYQTAHFWLEYPYWQMTPLMKSYYLLHSAYWTQQLLVLALGLEKPRKDFTELVVHHIVTLWLIGWSYLINLTPIGNAVFLSMDASDVFLALSKLCNYLRLEQTKNISFAWFIVVWTYFRHWLNIVMLWSVWTEFDLIPDFAKKWSPKDGVWLVHWMKYQVFIPMFALQIVNLFCALSSTTGLDDERSDDEDDGHEVGKKPLNGHGEAKVSLRQRSQK
ncbi:longevity assurance proteins LAG1/LAC1 [Hysterangium stoloniferum]|nr:longevity assurance proteins LAG1/LAC1 [Hysterangium stoloniferum]